MKDNWIDRLPDASRRALESAMVPRRFAAGALIFGRTEAAKGIYVIRSGSALFCLDGANGRRLLLKILRENELFGESVAYDGQPAPVSIEARSELVADMVPLARLVALRREFPEIDRELGKVAAANLRATLTVLEEQALLPLAERARQRLSILAGEDPRPARTPGFIGLEMTQAEIAAALGASRQATNGILAELEAAGLVWRHFRMLEVRVVGDQPGSASSL